MELVYKVSANEIPTYEGNGVDKILNNDRVSCSLSSRNVLAFSVFPTSNAAHRYMRWCHVYVCDLDSPWNAFLVTSSEHPVVSLKWHVNSEKLLVADSNGSCQLWLMEDYMINKWRKAGEIKMRGEQILNMAWFSTGISIYLNVDRKDSALYCDKFCTVVNKPTVSHFGGRALDGFIAVTATGLVSTGILEPMESTLQTTQSSLGPAHMRFALADICHTKDGQMMVAASNGHMSSLIHCHIVSVTSQRSCQIDSKAASSFYIKGDGSDSRVTHVNFAGAGNPDTLFIGTSTAMSSCIEIWHLVEQNIFLHSAFHDTSPSHAKESKFKTVKWMHRETISCGSPLTAVAPSTLHLVRMNADFSSASGVVTSYISALYRDGTVKLIQSQLGQVLTTTQLDLSDEWEYPLTVVSQTMSGCGFVIVNQSGVWLYRLINERDQPMYVSPSQLVMLLEYCIISGHDSWDVMLAIKQGMAEGIVLKLSDTFHKQPASVQDRMSMRLLGAKMATYLLSGGGRIRAVEVQAQLVLAGIVVAINQTLRPNTVTAHSLSPSENLAVVVSKTVETDVDKIILTLDSHDFIVDPGLLMSLQHLTQWLANFAVLLLISLPHLSSHTDFPGATLLKDAALLETLRELMVVVRIWSMIHRPCEPRFLTSSSLDCLPLVFALTTRVWLCVREGSELDEGLIDECAMLPTKIFPPPIEQVYTNNSRSNYLYTQPLPLHLRLNQQPDFVIDSIPLQPFILEVGSDSKHHRDIIHQTGLGSHLAAGVKQCLRCGCMTAALADSPKVKVLSTAMRAWELRWSRSCLCAGFWKFTQSDA